MSECCPALEKQVEDLKLELKALRHLHSDKTSAFELCLLVWFVARGSSGAGQFKGDDAHARAVKTRQEFEHFWRDPHGYYKEHDL